MWLRGAIVLFLVGCAGAVVGAGDLPAAVADGPGPQVERLAAHELITTEGLVEGHWHLPGGSVYSTKGAHLAGEFLVNRPVRGGVALAGKELGEARQQIEAELLRLLGKDLANRRTFEWLEIRRVPVPAHIRAHASKNSPIGRWAKTRKPEILYFWALKLDGKYRLQILGQQGEFVSVFIGCDRRPDDVWALALRVAPFLGRQTFSEANVPSLDDTYMLLRKNDFLRVICGDRSYETRLITVNGRTRREVDPRRFFGISVDVDLRKMPPA